MNNSVSPYTIYRTLENFTIPYGKAGYWRYFVLDENGKYVCDPNYIYKPEWVLIDDPEMIVGLPPPPEKPSNVLKGFVAVLQKFRMAEDGFYLLDKDEKPIYDPKWIIVRECDESAFTLTSTE